MIENVDHYNWDYRLVIEIVNRYGWDYRLLIENDGRYGPKSDWILRLTIAMVEKKIGVWKRSSRDCRSRTPTAMVEKFGRGWRLLLASVQVLDGVMVHRIFKEKQIYIRPVEDICDVGISSTKRSLETSNEDEDRVETPKAKVTLSFRMSTFWLFFFYHTLANYKAIFIWPSIKRRGWGRGWNIAYFAPLWHWTALHKVKFSCSSRLKKYIRGSKLLGKGNLRS